MRAPTTTPIDAAANALLIALCDITDGRRIAAYRDALGGINRDALIARLAARLSDALPKTTLDDAQRAVTRDVRRLDFLIRLLDATPEGRA